MSRTDLTPAFLGVDMNFGMLKTASSILENKYVSYPRRKSGLAFERREFPAVFENAGNVDFWVCDATALPFSDEVFSAGVSLNVLDCVRSPYDHLKELARILMPGSRAIVSTPYDWSANAIPVESWLGGHSQRSKHKGASEAVLRSLLAGGDHPNAVEKLYLISEEELQWTLRLHDRSFMEYLVQMIIVQKNHIPEQTGLHGNQPVAGHLRSVPGASRRAFGWASLCLLLKC